MITSVHVRTMLGVLAGLGMVGAPTAASAVEFSPDGSTRWVELARSLIEAANTGADRMAAVCPSTSPFNSDLLHEMTQEPQWAYVAHVSICIGYKNPTYACSNFKRAISALKKADPAKDPPEAVAIAGKLEMAIVSLGTEFNDAKVCKFKA